MQFSQLFQRLINQQLGHQCRDCGLIRLPFYKPYCAYCEKADQ